MSTDLNKELVRRFFNDVCSGGDLKAADELFSDGHIYHGPDSISSMIIGLEGIKKEVALYHEAFEGARWILHEIIVAGEDQVIVRWTGAGRHTGQFYGIDPTGREVSIPGTWICRIEGEKIVESWGMWDTLRLIQTLEMAPQLPYRAAS